MRVGRWATRQPMPRPPRRRRRGLSRRTATRPPSTPIHDRLDQAPGKPDRHQPDQRNQDQRNQDHRNQDQRNQDQPSEEPGLRSVPAGDISAATGPAITRP
ncbi:hypothetical protein KRM28CT15_00440 [Krasilnikovia sp. M28-CT-15]